MTGPAASTPPLQLTVLEVERHVAEAGWDQPPHLYALVETADLLRREPHLAAALGMSATTAAAGSLTPVEQEGLSQGPLDDVLAGIAWPGEVLGCALVHEVVVLPPEVEHAAPPEGEAVAAWAAAHPARRDVRLAVGVLRDGSRACALRLRAGTESAADDDVLSGPDLAPRLADALLATLD